jgi:uncharacterized membrane protein
MLLELLATAAAGIFAGAAVYISVVQQPALVQLGTPAAIRFFSLMYGRAAALQASLAVLGSLAGVSAWWSDRGSLWLLGAALLGFVVPFTLLVVMPINTRLKDPTLDSASPEAADLLQRWSRLHALRTVTSSLSLLAFLFAILGGLRG